jgi:exopolyphosphatase/guanosine-5'-triphosphate,3'-diphosphate pyrophosphatase
MDRFATIDVGTNSVLLLVADRTNDGHFRAVAERAEITRLGKNVDQTGQLASESIAATAEVVRRYVEQARGLGSRSIVCVATSAARDANNGEAFFSRVRQECGIDVEVLSGDAEAQMSYLAATRDLGAARPLVVLDIGGGSTELVYGEAGEVRFRRSFDIGSVRLTERLIRTDPPSLVEQASCREAIDTAFSDLPAPQPGATLCGIAGTVTTVCAVARAVSPYDASLIHGQVLRLDEVRATLDLFFTLPLARRRALPGMQEKRADVIPVGTLILERAMARLAADRVTVSDRGVRWGLLYERFSKPGV